MEIMHIPISFENQSPGCSDGCWPQAQVLTEMVTRLCHKYNGNQAGSAAGIICTSIRIEHKMTFLSHAMLRQW